MQRWIALAAAVGASACIPAGGQQAPAPVPTTAPAGESYASVTTSDDASAGASTAVPADPYADAPCPADLSLDVGARKIDGRDPADTIHVKYAKEHLKRVKDDGLVGKDDAIERVLAIESDHPGVVPAGFRTELGAHARDPSYRLYMARCELATDATTRRAGYDAGLAFLLGAGMTEVLPLVEQSFYPDGPTVMSCTKTADCGGGDMKCDRVEKECRSKRHKTASFLSAAELDIEDTLTRAYARLLTPEAIEDTRYHADDLVGTWAYGRYIKCSGVLCNITRYEQTSGSTRLVYWDRRYRGESYGGASEDVLTGDAKVCFDHTTAADYSQCEGMCGSLAETDPARCLARCAAWCK